MEHLAIRYREALDVNETTIDAESFIWSVDGDQNVEIKAFMGTEMVARLWFKEPTYIIQRTVVPDA